MNDGTSRNRKAPLGPTDTAQEPGQKPAGRKRGQRSEAPNQSFETGTSTEGEDTPAALVGNHLPASAYPNGNNLPEDIEDDRNLNRGKNRQLPNR
jgi:hypothetical protein